MSNQELPEQPSYTPSPVTEGLQEATIEYPEHGSPASNEVIYDQGEALRIIRGRIHHLVPSEQYWSLSVEVREQIEREAQRQASLSPFLERYQSDYEKEADNILQRRGISLVERAAVQQQSYSAELEPDVSAIESIDAETPASVATTTQRVVAEPISDVLLQVKSPSRVNGLEGQTTNAIANETGNPVRTIERALQPIPKTEQSTTQEGLSLEKGPSPTLSTKEIYENTMLEIRARQQEEAARLRNRQGILDKTLKVRRSLDEVYSRGLEENPGYYYDQAMQLTSNPEAISDHELAAFLQTRVLGTSEYVQYLRDQNETRRREAIAAAAEWLRSQASMARDAMHYEGVPEWAVKVEPEELNNTHQPQEIASAGLEMLFARLSKAAQTTTEHVGGGYEQNAFDIFRAARNATWNVALSRDPNNHIWKDTERYLLETNCAFFRYKRPDGEEGSILCFIEAYQGKVGCVTLDFAKNDNGTLEYRWQRVKLFDFLRLFAADKTEKTDILSGGRRGVTYKGLELLGETQGTQWIPFLKELSKNDAIWRTEAAKLQQKEALLQSMAREGIPEEAWKTFGGKLSPDKIGTRIPPESIPEDFIHTCTESLAGILSVTQQRTEVHLTVQSAADSYAQNERIVLGTNANLFVQQIQETGTGYRNGALNKYIIVQMRDFSDPTTFVGYISNSELRATQGFSATQQDMYIRVEKGRVMQVNGGSGLATGILPKAVAGVVAEVGRNIMGKRPANGGSYDAWLNQTSGAALRPAETQQCLGEIQSFMQETATYMRSVAQDPNFNPNTRLSPHPQQLDVRIVNGAVQGPLAYTSLPVAQKSNI